MNIHSITEDTDRWWWTSAGAGMAAAAAIVGIIVVAPVGTHAMPADPAPAAVVIPEPVDTAGPVDIPRDRQCFIEQARWNVAYDGPVPRC